MYTALIVIIFLVMAVIFVNGWTDAPNAIATAVSTRAIKPQSAVLMAVVFNFLGAFFMTWVNASVAATISNMVRFEPTASSQPLVVLAAALFAIVIWATAAWYFGIPTSESHALIAGVTGAAMALGGWDAIVLSEWGKVLIGLVISTVVGFGSGYGIVLLVEALFRKTKRNAANGFFRKAQVGGAAMMAFMHGAQDGQKFMGVFLLGISLFGVSVQGTGVQIPVWLSVAQDAGGNFIIPMWLIAACSIVMGLGTSVGGYRIIKSVGMGIVKMQVHQGFASDLAASICLLFSSLFGIPLSTTHTKTTAIMGVGAARRIKAVNWGTAKEMVLAWVLTFPGCGLIGYVMAKLFLKIF